MPTTPEQREILLSEIADGKSVRSICRDNDIPERSVYYDLRAEPEFAQQYAQAREAQADKIFEECLEIADQYDKAEEKLEGGTDHINRARLRIDTRKWMAGKLRPKVYGEKLELSGDEKHPLTIAVIERVIVRPK